MIQADDFITEAAAQGFTFYTGVPCSFLTPLINGVLGSDRLNHVGQNHVGLNYVGAASEGEAVAIAAGAWLAGRGTVVMCQNSGLGNAINPLTSLNYPFRIPSLLISTWRGEPGIPDEPQHVLMGKIMNELLATIEIAHETFPAEPEAIAPALARAKTHMSDSGLPYAFVLRKGSVADEDLVERPRQCQSPGQSRDYRTGGPRPSREAILRRLLELADPHAAIIATTGKTGRELFTIDDRAQHLYQVGSMGGASGMALGVALNTQKPVIVLDGDGAALMKLGSFATIGAYQPKNLLHLLLDNGVHDSTGGQPTVSHHVDFAQIALACGYRGAFSCDSLDGLAEVYGQAAEGPTLIRIHIAPGSMAKLGRPTVTPEAVAQRFRRFLAA